MKSRTDKYYDEEQVTVRSRTQRNAELYKDINKTELENFEIKSNATVIGNSRNNIDVEKIKSILDTHYKDSPKRKSIVIEDSPKEEVPPIFETKEYDLNVILDKAKEDKEEDYNLDRNKKLRDTQFDILNSLNMDDYVEDYEEEDAKSSATSQNEDLQKLIDTITLNEQATRKEEVVEETEENSFILEDSEEEQIKSSEETDPLDIFSELKGSRETAILTGLSEKTQELIEEEQEQEDKTQTTQIDKSFFTKSAQLSKKDFEDFEDFDDKPMGKGVKAIIIILILLFIAGGFILYKIFF